MQFVVVRDDVPQVLGRALLADKGGRLQKPPLLHPEEARDASQRPFFVRLERLVAHFEDAGHVDASPLVVQRVERPELRGLVGERPRELVARGPAPHELALPVLEAVAREDHFDDVRPRPDDRLERDGLPEDGGGDARREVVGRLGFPA